MNREHGRKTAAHRPHPGGEVQQDRAGPPRGARDAGLVPPEVAAECPQPISHRAARADRGRESAGNRAQPIVEQGAQGARQLRHVHVRAGPPELRDGDVERDASYRHACTTVLP